MGDFKKRRERGVAVSVFDTAEIAWLHTTALRQFFLGKALCFSRCDDFRHKLTFRFLVFPFLGERWVTKVFVQIVPEVTYDVRSNLSSDALQVRVLFLVCAASFSQIRS